MFFSGNFCENGRIHNVFRHADTSARLRRADTSLDSAYQQQTLCLRLVLFLHML